MNFEKLHASRQFRGKRTRNGKLCRNKIGGFERSRDIDDCFGKSRRQLLEQIRADETSAQFKNFAQDELDRNLSICDCCNDCGGSGAGDAAFDSGRIETETGVVLLRFAAGGMLSSAHFVSKREAFEF